VRNDREKIFIVIYPYKFSEFLWENLELGKINQNVDVEVWDISFLLNKRFFNGIFAQTIHRPNVLQFKSIFQLLKHVKYFKTTNAKRDIFYLNEIPLSTVKNILFYKYLLNDVPGPRILEILNPGYPTSYEQSNQESISSNPKFFDIKAVSSSKIELVIRLFSTIISKLGNAFTKNGTVKLIAGTEWESICSSEIKKRDIRVIHGHSGDISKCIMNRELLNEEIPNEIITHLDTAGPMFETDSLLIRRKTYLTNEKWYPLLCNFFERLERRFKVDVIVAGHYKSGFISPSPIFDNREVRYMETLNLIKRSKIVTTQYSTATSMAVYLKKPIIFIYSDELINDTEAMLHIRGFSTLLKAQILNIDKLEEETRFNLNVDTFAYESYFEKFLSSGNLNFANYQLIQRDFLGLK
jgi:hypothetical protein